MKNDADPGRAPLTKGLDQICKCDGWAAHRYPAQGSRVQPFVRSANVLCIN